LHLNLPLAHKPHQSIVPLPPSQLDDYETETLQSVRRYRHSAGCAGAALARLDAGEPACVTMDQASALAGYLAETICRSQRIGIDADHDEQELLIDVEIVAATESHLETFGRPTNRADFERCIMQALLGFITGDKIVSCLRGVLKAEIRQSEICIDRWDFKMESINRKLSSMRHALAQARAERGSWAKQRRAIEKEIVRVESELTRR